MYLVWTEVCLTVCVLCSLRLFKLKIEGQKYIEYKRHCKVTKLKSKSLDFEPPRLGAPLLGLA